MKSTFINFFLIILTFFNFKEVNAQREYIVVEKTMSNKQITYGSGDNITYKLKEEDFFRTNHIVALNDSSIEFHYNNILYRDISQVSIKGHRFTGFDVRGEDASFNDGVWIAGGSIFLAGTILKWASPKKVRLGGKYRIRYMNLNYK